MKRIVIFLKRLARWTISTSLVVCSVNYVCRIADLYAEEIIDGAGLATACMTMFIMSLLAVLVWGALNVE